MLAFGLWLAAVNECCFVRADVWGREVGADVAVEVSLISLSFEKVLLTGDVVDGKALFVFGEAEMSWNLVRVASTVANALRTSSQRKDAGEWLSVLALLELCNGVSELMGGGVAFGVSGMVSLSGDSLLVVTRVVVREDRLGGFVSVHNGWWRASRWSCVVSSSCCLARRANSLRKARSSVVIGSRASVRTSWSASYCVGSMGRK